MAKIEINDGTIGDVTIENNSIGMFNPSDAVCLSATDVEEMLRRKGFYGDLLDAALGNSYRLTPADELSQWGSYAYDSDGYSPSWGQYRAFIDRLSEDEQKLLKTIDRLVTEALEESRSFTNNKSKLFESYTALKHKLHVGDMRVEEILSSSDIKDLEDK